MLLIKVNMKKAANVRDWQKCLLTCFARSDVKKKGIDWHFDHGTTEILIPCRMIETDLLCL